MNEDELELQAQAELELEQEEQNSGQVQGDASGQAGLGIEQEQDPTQMLNDEPYKSIMQMGQAPNRAMAQTADAVRAVGPELIKAAPRIGIETGASVAGWMGGSMLPGGPITGYVAANAMEAGARWLTTQLGLREKFDAGDYTSFNPLHPLDTLSNPLVYNAIPLVGTLWKMAHPNPGGLAQSTQEALDVASRGARKGEITPEGVAKMKATGRIGAQGEEAIGMSNELSKSSNVVDTIGREMGMAQGQVVMDRALAQNFTEKVSTQFKRVTDEIINRVNPEYGGKGVIARAKQVGQAAFKEREELAKVLGDKGVRIQVEEVSPLLDDAYQRAAKLELNNVTKPIGEEIRKGLDQIKEDLGKFGVKTPSSDNVLGYTLKAEMKPEDVLNVMSNINYYRRLVLKHFDWAPTAEKGVTGSIAKGTAELEFAESLTAAHAALSQALDGAVSKAARNNGIGDFYVGRLRAANELYGASEATEELMRRFTYGTNEGLSLRAPTRIVQNQPLAQNVRPSAMSSLTGMADVAAEKAGSKWQEMRLKVSSAQKRNKEVFEREKDAVKNMQSYVNLNQNPGEIPKYVLKKDVDEWAPFIAAGQAYRSMEFFDAFENVTEAMTQNGLSPEDAQILGSLKFLPKDVQNEQLGKIAARNPQLFSPPQVMGFNSMIKGALTDEVEVQKMSDFNLEVNADDPAERIRIQELLGKKKALPKDFINKAVDVYGGQKMQVDDDLLTQAVKRFEGNKTSGYLDYNPKNGVNIGAGISLGVTSINELREKGVSEALLRKLAPYVGKTGDSAKRFLKNEPLTLSEEEVESLNTAFIQTAKANLSEKYEAATGSEFDKLPQEAQAVIYSLEHNVGSIEKKLPTAWRHITNSDWPSLQKFLQKTKWKQEKLAGRRNQEAEMLNAIVPKEDMELGYDQSEVRRVAGSKKVADGFRRTVYKS